MNLDNFGSVLGQAFTALFSALDGWLVVALVLSLFATAAFRPHQIHDRAKFLKAVDLLGRYLVVPVAIGLVLVFDMPPKLAASITQIALLLGRILLAMSIVQALRSIVPDASVRSEVA